MNGFLRRTWVVAGGVVVLAAVIAVAAYLIFRDDSGDGPGYGSPQAAVRTLLQAGQTGNTQKAYSVLCDNDRALAGQNPVLADGRVKKYTIVSTTRTDNDHAVVTASFTTTVSRGASRYDFPVSKTGGRWKVCVSDELKNLPTTLPT